MCKLCKKGTFAGAQTKKIISLVHKIKGTLHPKQVILFGSFARGDWHRGSDLDLLIIGDFKDRFFDRIGKVISLNKSDLNLEPLVYTQEEFARIKWRDFIQTILREGIVA